MLYYIHNDSQGCGSVPIFSPMKILQKPIDNHLTACYTVYVSILSQPPSADGTEVFIWILELN